MDKYAKIDKKTVYIRAKIIAVWKIVDKKKYSK